MGSPSWVSRAAAPLPHSIISQTPCILTALLSQQKGEQAAQTEEVEEVPAKSERIRGAEGQGRRGNKVERDRLGCQQRSERITAWNAGSLPPCLVVRNDEALLNHLDGTSWRH